VTGYGSFQLGFALLFGIADIRVKRVAERPDAEVEQIAEGNGEQNVSEVNA